MNNILPINLCNFGVKRRPPREQADLMTIYMTPYPVITNYKKWCSESNLLIPFGGGNLIEQVINVPGYITSGYRDKILNANKYSAHLYAMAIDVAIGKIDQQIIEAKIAVKYFSRIGFYPDNGFIHVDLAPENWIERYNKARFWVISKEKRSFFSKFNDATDYAEKLAA